MIQYTFALVFTFAAVVEARKVQRHLDRHRWGNALASTIGAAACLTMAQEAWRRGWL